MKEFVRAIEFSSDDATAPLSAADKADELRPRTPAGLRDDQLPTQASPTAMFRPTLRVHLAPLWAKLGPVTERLAPLWAKLGSWTTRLTPLRTRAIAWWTLMAQRWGQLPQRTRMTVAATAGAVLVASVVVAWPRHDQSATDSAEPGTSPVAPPPAVTPAVPSGNAAHPISAARSLLRLRVSPSAVAVAVDGAPVAGRADSIPLTPGRHLVAVTKVGYRPWTDSVLASDSGVIARTIALVALPGRLSVSTNIPAAITINGKSVSNPAADVEVPAGAARVHIKVGDAGGGWETDSSVTVRAGATVRKRFQLGTTAVAAREVHAGRRPSALPAQVLTVPAQSALTVLAEGYAAWEVDLLSPKCVRFVDLFWDVMGYDVDVARLCAAAAILIVKGNTPERLINFTRFVRTKDGAIETVERPAVVAEWRNDVTGKRLRFRISGDSLTVTDETPQIASARVSTRKAQRSVTVRKATEGDVPVSIVRIDPFGMTVKTPRDSLPVAASASHGHRIGSCSGRLTFDGERFKFVPDKGDHTYSFGMADALGGTVSGNRGTLRVRIGGGTERLTMREWEPVFEAVIVARSR